MAANLLNVGVIYGNSTLRTSGKWATRAIFGYGSTGTRQNITNLVNNYGGVATDTTGVGQQETDWLVQVTVATKLYLVMVIQTVVEFP